ncbi:MAG TPA: transglycosylase SLT domain-containing protein [Beijerinckiaceae bacterium]|jgi:hypothetical protein
MALALAGALMTGVACGEAAAQDVLEAAVARNVTEVALTGNVAKAVAVHSFAKAVAAQHIAKAAVTPDIVKALAQDIAKVVAAQDVSDTAGRSDSGEADPNELIKIGERKVARWLVDTVIRAAKVTGIDPAYAMALADKESGFDPDIRASTSSAVGLFQFLEGTWLQVLNEHAGRHGYAEVAAAIEVVGGRPTVAADARSWIMSLRRDPYLSALMACEMAREASERLAKVTNGSVQDGDLYLAHFLGAAGAERMLKLVEKNPSQKAHAAFPKAAKANRSVFAAKGSKKKKTAATVAQVRARINAMMQSRLESYASLAASPR